MLDVLQRHAEAQDLGCVVMQWINTRSTEEQTVFEKIKQNSQSISLSLLFKEMNSTEPLPFKLTAFRSHIRGYCTCQK